MESTNPCPEEEQAHTLEWAYGFFAPSESHTGTKQMGRQHFVEADESVTRARRAIAWRNNPQA